MRLFIFLIFIFTSSASAASVASVKYVNECVETKVSKEAGTVNEMKGSYDVVAGQGRMNVPTPTYPTVDDVNKI